MARAGYGLEKVSVGLIYLYSEWFFRSVFREMHNKRYSMAKDDRLYRVMFVNQDQVFELYVKHVYQSDLWGFVEVEGFVFGNRSGLVVDPGEEKLKTKFSGVKRSFIPQNAIVRIDEVEREGVAKITEAKGSVAAFPMPPMPKV
ncbi:MAG: hypothetical protein ACJAZ4_000912 [Neptuniibacter pectenicola]|jgi:hypothetical protein|tara:strand:+ start:753 stop:1184 length:432 start_codon:yes stop_codon:yes gene_type:complete